MCRGGLALLAVLARFSLGSLLSRTLLSRAALGVRDADAVLWSTVGQVRVTDAGGAGRFRLLRHLLAGGGLLRGGVGRPLAVRIAPTRGALRHRGLPRLSGLLRTLLVGLVLLRTLLVGLVV